jgi:hypothetical protein
MTERNEQISEARSQRTRWKWWYGLLGSEFFIPVFFHQLFKHAKVSRTYFFQISYLVLALTLSLLLPVVCSLFDKNIDAVEVKFWLNFLISVSLFLLGSFSPPHQPFHQLFFPNPVNVSRFKRFFSMAFLLGLGGMLFFLDRNLLPSESGLGPFSASIGFFMGGLCTARLFQKENKA